MSLTGTVIISSSHSRPMAGDIEPGLPDKATVIDTFKRLSDTIGPERVLWRYDPILLNPVYTIGRHISLFSDMARCAQGLYQQVHHQLHRSVQKHSRQCFKACAGRQWTMMCKMEIARAFAQIAGENGIALDTCAEGIDLSALGIGHARCIDAQAVQQPVGHEPAAASVTGTSARPASARRAWTSGRTIPAPAGACTAMRIIILLSLVKTLLHMTRLRPCSLANKMIETPPTTPPRLWEGDL